MSDDTLIIDGRSVAGDGGLGVENGHCGLTSFTELQAINSTELTKADSSQ